MKNFVFLFLLLSAVLSAQEKWENLSLPKGAELLDVYATNAENVISVGENGTVFTSIDSGKTWTPQQSGINKNINSVAAFGDANMFAVGDSGLIINSNDAGSTWNTQLSNITTDLYSNSFVDSLTGWCCGDSGKILYTTDGGSIWNEQSSGTQNSLNSIDFVDSLTGWCVGDHGVVLHTDDGGNNWMMQNTGEIIDFSDVDFVNDSVGYISTSSNSAIFDGFKTTDGGATWTAISNLIGARWKKVQFLDENRGWFVRNDGILYYTNDGGDNWAFRDFYRYHANALYFIDENIGWVVGGESGTLITRTVDSGYNFDFPFVDLTPSPINAVKFINADQGWLGGGNYIGVSGLSPDLVFNTADAGNNWNNVIYTAGKGIYDIEMWGVDTIWVLSGSGVYKSTDGGNNWNYHHITSSGILSVSFVDGQYGWAAGIGKLMFKTEDGGETWQQLNTASLDNIYFQSVYFTDRNNGWAAGYIVGTSPTQNTVIYTNDGGTTWTPQLQTPGVRMYLHFIDGLNGWAAGGSSIFRTTNGGVVWDSLSSGTSENIYDIYFINNYLGWAVGSNGLILHSSDSGNTWLSDSIGINDNLYTVFALDSINVWAAGDNGVLLRKNDNINKIDETDDRYLLPGSPKLLQNYPNPFNPTTAIGYQLPDNSHVILRIYNMLGQEVKTLVNAQQKAGSYKTTWNGLNSIGKPVASGVYYYQLFTDKGLSQTKKLLLLR